MLIMICDVGFSEPTAKQKLAHAHQMFAYTPGAASKTSGSPKSWTPVSKNSVATPKSGAAKTHAQTKVAWQPKNPVYKPQYVPPPSVTPGQKPQPKGKHGT